MNGKSFGISRESERERWSELIVLVANRDERAFEQLYAQTKSAVFGLALRLLNDRGEAEEIMMDVYLKVWEHADQFSSERGSVLTWLLIMTRSKALDRIRRKAVRVSTWLNLEDVQIPAGPGAGPDSFSEFATMKGRVQRVLTDLPQTHRQAVELALYEQMSHSEIAARLEQPIGTVKSRIRSAMIRIRNEVRAL